MKAKDHLESYKEHKDTIFDWALRVKGLKNSQRIVGLHALKTTLFEGDIIYNRNPWSCGF